MRFSARALIGGLAVAGLCAGAVIAQKATLAIATGGTGGVYYPLGGGLANILSKKVPGLTATAEVTGGSVDNLKLIGSGKSEVAFTMVDARWTRCRARTSSRTARSSCARWWCSTRIACMSSPSKARGINKLSDLKGKRVSTGSPGSGTEIMAFRVLEAAGLDKDKDMRRERLGVAESVNAIKDGKIDAFFWVGGVPTAAVTDLARHAGHRRSS